MVRSKDAPKKKPKDPLLTPPSKPRGGFPVDEGRPWNRGGAAMSPAPASVPGYMRGTSSSDAKTGRHGPPAAASVSVSASASPARRRAAAASVPASASPARRRPAVRVLATGKVLFPEEPAPGSGLGRATCSSTMKEAKFPDALDLAPGATDAEGPAALRVCPYTYCSLNGHAHAPAVPLRSFLASRRRLIKTQQSMKLRGVSAFRKKSSGEKAGGGSGGGGAKVAPLIDDEAVGDFFVEVYAGPRVSSDMSCSDMSLDEMEATVRRLEFVVFDRCGAEESNKKGKDLAVCDDAEHPPRLEERQMHDSTSRDSSSECSGADIGGDFVEELPWMRYQGYEYDSLDDEISEEQRIREEPGGAEISEDQEEEQGTSGTSADVCEEDATQEQEEIGQENALILARETEMVADEGVGCRVEACEELDAKDEGNILDTFCLREASAGQGTSEDKLPDDVYKFEIPDQDVTGRADSTLEESCKDDNSADQEANDDECSVESDSESEIIEEQDAKDEGNTPDDSEMEISEDTISGDGCADDLSEEVTSRAAPEGDTTSDNAFEQYFITASDVFEQDGSPGNAQNDAEKELGVTTSKFECASEETAIVQQINEDNHEDAQKELHITTYISEEACEESVIAQESNLDGISTPVNDEDQMESEITACRSKDASDESGVAQESSLNDNTEHATDGADMGQEITSCKLEDASEETGIVQEIIDDSACVSYDANYYLEITNCKSVNALEKSVVTEEADQSDSSANVSSDDQETVKDGNSACVSNDSQNNLIFSKCELEDASKDFVTTQEFDRSDSSANVSSDAHNESEVPTSELSVITISDDTENESKLSTCKSEDVCEESVIGHGDSSAIVDDGTQNVYKVSTCDSEGVEEESDVIQEGEDEDNTMGAQKQLEIEACESGGASEKSAMPQQAGGGVNTIDASDCSQKDATMPKFDAGEDIYATEETSQSFSVQMPAEPINTKEPSIDDICGAFSVMNLKGDVYFDPAESPTCPMNKLIISRRRRTPEEEEYLRGFNPRAPNFLPLELDPDAEKVDLKHQLMDERKNAEEWMIDYALRRAVTNLAPDRKKKVELLVQAFETVLPHDEDDKKSITSTRPVQACN